MCACGVLTTRDGCGTRVPSWSTTWSTLDCSEQLRARRAPNRASATQDAVAVRCRTDCSRPFWSVWVRPARGRRWWAHGWSRDSHGTGRAAQGVVVYVEYVAPTLPSDPPPRCASAGDTSIVETNRLFADPACLLKSEIDEFRASVSSL